MSMDWRFMHIPSISYNTCLPSWISFVLFYLMFSLSENVYECTDFIHYACLHTLIPSVLYYLELLPRG
ncbi:uncharacterized protein F5891DRAFT_1037134 [Suillus fuscotomentosus]|uniref:Uncharacterized protein n=1 Tax=Suillus fuscotomentosus TaxID=1912939 RepID=A0AAD4E7P8_9AGAM|nr:uncharacterized protein F5891DRAFT_1037134 [Suillus fuscotomentosus]KAG1899868.1 hypothetical protein F5891DRAFT_1037134 [Suillus fuscotomentosus]